MSDPTMALPAGKTCADCAHVARCTMLGCTSRTATACDFAPSRFVEAYRAPERPKGGGYVSPLWPPPGDPRAAHHCKKGEPCRCGPTRPRAVRVEFPPPVTIADTGTGTAITIEPPPTVESAPWTCPNCRCTFRGVTTTDDAAAQDAADRRFFRAQEEVNADRARVATAARRAAIEEVISFTRRDAETRNPDAPPSAKRTLLRLSDEFAARVRAELLPGCTCVRGPSSAVPSQSCPLHGHGPIPGRK